MGNVQAARSACVRFTQSDSDGQGRNRTADAGLSGPLTHSPNWLEINGCHWRWRAFVAGVL